MGGAEGTVTWAAGRGTRSRQKYRVRSDGMPSVTHQYRRGQVVKASELTVRWEAGRTHQVRGHMSAVGHPLINDPVYGRADSRLPLPGQALHAWRLEFKHPATKAFVTFEAEPPPEYLATLAFLRV